MFGPLGNFCSAGNVSNIPSNTNGGVIPNTPNTVSHVIWNGTALVDQYPNTWTQVGTVPQITTGPFLPAKDGSQPEDTNYYTLTPHAKDVLDFTGNFTFAVVFNPSSFASTPTLFWNGPATYTGGVPSYWLLINTNGTVEFFCADGISHSDPTSANAAILNGINVVTGGTDGTNIWIQLNGGTPVTKSAVSGTSSSNNVFQLGTVQAGEQPFAGTIYEAWFSSDAPTDASLAAITERVLGELTSQGQVISLTNSTGGSYVVGSQVYYSAPNVPRIETASDGKGASLLEPASTNQVLYSQDLSQAAWTTSSATVTGSYGVAPDGTTTSSLITVASSGGVYSSADFSADSGDYTLSFWAKSAVGALIDVQIHDDTAGHAACIIEPTLTTTWTYYTVSGTTTATNNLYVDVSCGSAGNFEIWGLQAEALPFPTSYIPTTSGSVERSADELTASSSMLGNSGSFSCDFQQINDTASTTVGAGGLFCTEANTSYALELYLAGDVLTLQLNGDNSNKVTSTLSGGHSSAFAHVGCSWVTDGSTTTTFSLYYNSSIIGSATSANAMALGTPLLGGINPSGTLEPLGGAIRNVKLALDMFSGL